MDKRSQPIALKLLVAFTLLTALLLNGCSTVSDYSYSEYRRGKADAQKDIQANRLITEVYGFGASKDSAWGRLLKESYGIEQRMVAGCIVDGKIVGHAKGYNEVSHAEIERRFGKDIWDKVEMQLRRENQQASQP